MMILIVPQGAFFFVIPMWSADDPQPSFYPSYEIRPGLDFGNVSIQEDSQNSLEALFPFQYEKREKVLKQK